MTYLPARIQQAIIFQNAQSSDMVRTMEPKKSTKLGCREFSTSLQMKLCDWLYFHHNNVAQ